jgi:hypothetical protein
MHLFSTSGIVSWVLYHITCEGTDGTSGIDRYDGEIISKQRGTARTRCTEPGCEIVDKEEKEEGSEYGPLW